MTDAYRVTGSQLEEKVRQLAADSPDFVYEPATGPRTDPSDPSGNGCAYFHGGPDHCGCIIGHAIRPWLNVEDFFMPNGEFLYEGDPARYIVSIVTTDVLSEEQKIWFDTVQDKQDRGETWSVAVRLADRERFEGESDADTE